MKIDTIKDFSKRKVADLLVVPFFEGEEIALGVIEKETQSDVSEPLSAADFKGKYLSSSLVYAAGRKEKRILLIGLGEKSLLNDERIRVAYAEIVKISQKLQLEKINIVYPSKIRAKNLFKSIVEGISLSNYTFNKFKTKTNGSCEKEQVLKEVYIIGSDKNKRLIDDILTISTAVHLTRDLVNNNADEETPTRLAQVAKGFEKISKKVKVEIFDKKRIEKEKLNLLLAVNSGSSKEPAFIIINYLGNPSSKDKTALVGKGITFDSGGLCLKPAGGMFTMKSDMSGAASVIGAMYAIASLNLKKNVIAVIPATENSIDANSYKPGDVYTSYKGITVEIGNTDAEGRLILADALAYVAKRFSPNRIIDIASLTGAISISLGRELAGFFSSSKELTKKLFKSAANTGENLWEMPLFDEYREMLNSEIADINNTGGREAGSITAALFLKEFVPKEIPWAHIDIGGASYYKKNKGYITSLATGFGVRLFVDFISKI